MQYRNEESRVDSASESPRILLVMQAGRNRELLRDSLKRPYNVSVADSFETDAEFDLCIIDAPTLDRLWADVERIKKEVSPDFLPFLLIVTEETLCSYNRSLWQVVDEIITIPVSKFELRGRLDILLRTRWLEQQKEHQAHLDTVNRLAVAAEYKDEDTGAHVERVGEYSAIMAREAQMAASEIERIHHAAPMHDLGKIGIPDSILLKPGKLNDDEFEQMQQHTLIGQNILSNSSSDLLTAGAVIAATHHEKWNGEGYPAGLSGEDIPFFGRICAVADVFDALTSDRPYRKAMPVEKATNIMKKGRGQHFDPTLLDLFFENLDEVLAIREKHTEPDTPVADA